MNTVHDGDRRIDGIAGAADATIGVFAPSFRYVALLDRIVPECAHAPPHARLSTTLESWSC